MSEFMMFLQVIGYLIALLAGIGTAAICINVLLHLFQHRPTVQRLLRHL